MAELINEFGNLDILCNARVDTAMYELPPAPTGKRGRPRKYGEENINFLPLSCYLLRWNLEVSYYEGKTFWSLEEYRIRSREGIERLINLLAVSYSAMTLLPYSDETFSSYQSFSAQETRFEIGQQIQANIIFNSFVESLETVKKARALVKLLEHHIQSWIRKVQKL